MSLGGQQPHPTRNQEESRGDRETRDLPDDVQEPLVPFKNSTFDISGTPQLGLSFGKPSGDENQNQSKSQSSLFDDEHENMFEVRSQCKEVSVVIQHRLYRHFV